MKVTHMPDIGTATPTPPQYKPDPVPRPMLNRYRIAMLHPTVNSQTFKRLVSAGLADYSDLPGLGLEDPTTGAAHARAAMDEERRRGERDAKLEQVFMKTLTSWWGVE